jgi:SAM-dependent methyltransferase
MISCPICEKEGALAIARSESGATYFCQGCTVVFNLFESDPAAIYSTRYYEECYEPIREKQLRNSLDILEKAKGYVRGGPLLDYGCGSGTFLAAARMAGFGPNAGADISGAALELARKKLEGDEILLDLQSSQVPRGRKFNVISLFDSVGHIPKAKAVLTDLVRNHLNGEGVLLIRTPRFTKQARIYARTLAGIMPNKYKSAAFFIPTRYFLFSEQAMRELVRSVGLQVYEIWRQRDYRVPQKKGWRGAGGGKAFVGRTLFHTIPKLLQATDSMVLFSGFGSSGRGSSRDFN